MGHGSRWSVALAVMIVGLAALPATSTARAPGRTSAQLRRLSLDLSRLSGRIDGRARRRSLLATARSASRAFRRRRLCVALRKVDSLKQPLSLGSTYRRGRVPRRAVRRLRRHIDRIDRPLLRSRAGRRCSRRVHRARSGASQHPGVVPPPEPPARNGEEEGEEATERLAPGRRFRPLRNPGPEVPVEDAQEPVASGRPPWAAGIGDPLRFFVNQDLGVPSRIGQPSETSVASAGPVVVYTGNDDAEFSLDGGLTFRRLDPVSIDDDGVQDDGGFCCDQVIHYAPQINRFIWLIQFDCKPVERPAACATGADRENRYRLAIASPERISASAADPPSAWDYWDITPAQFKQNGKWFDYPDLAVPDPRFGGNSLYMTWNVFGPNPGDNGAMFARVNLRDLAKGRFNYQYIFDSSRINTSPAQSTRGRAFISGHKDAGALRILYADDASMLAFDRVVPHPTIPTESWESFVAGGGNWFSRSRLWAVGGSVARLGELWVAWGAARDWCIANCDREDPKDRITKRGYDQPHIEIAVLDSSTFTLKREIVLHNSAFAFTYPALDVNSEGDVGIAYSYGGGAKSPSPGVGILTGHPELFRTSAGSPTGGQGDYNTIHRHYPDGTRFSAAGFAKKSDGYDHWQYTQFGRGPLPPKGPTGSPPDLVVSSLTKGSFTVTNSGGAAAGAFVVRLTGAPPDATFAYPGLSPGESATQDFFCRGVTRTATVDADSQVVESREDNNQATVSYPGCIS